MVVAEVGPTHFRPFEVTAAHLIYVGLGGFIVLLGMFSLFIKERLYLGEAPIAALFGIIIGPAALNLFNPSGWANGHQGNPGGEITNEVTLEVLRVTVALSVFAVGVELPKKYILRHWRSLAMLLGPVMIWGWLITGAFIYALVPGLDFLNSLVVAACVTPTDPILAQAVVGGPWAERHVPAHLRHLLSAESGCNDGAAFPFLYLALFLTTNRGDTKKAIAEWFYDALAYQIIFGTCLGALIGYLARKIMRFSERHKLIDRESFVAQYVSLAILSMGVNVLLGSDDLLAAFACGTAFAWDGWFTKQTEDSNFSNIVDLLFNCAAFIYVGALMPFHEFVNAASTLSLWRLFVLTICVLLLKRFPVLLALWKFVPDIKTFREAIFAGHFGPIGIGAIFIATLGRQQLTAEEVPEIPETSNDVLALTIQPIVYFFVLCSIAVHGLTIPFFAFSRRAHTVTRTWSRHASFSSRTHGEDDEPGWMARVIRKVGTGTSLRYNKEGDGGGMSEIQRVLNSQLGVIGRGAIGGDAEKDLRKDETSGDDDNEDVSPIATGSGSSSYVMDESRARNAERDLEKGDFQDGDEHGRARHYDGDDVGDWDPEYEEPTSDWCGEDTIEMRRYREKMAQKKAAKADRERDMEEGRAGDDDDDEAPMDREVIQGDVKSDEQDPQVRKDKEGQHTRRDGKKRDHAGSDPDPISGRTKEEAARAEAISKNGGGDDDAGYPRTNSWVEGSKLVIEYLRSRTDDPVVEVIPLRDDEQDSISSAESPAWAWVQTHHEELGELVQGGEHQHWGVKDAAHNLLRHGVPAWVRGDGAKSSKEESGSESASAPHFDAPPPVVAEEGPGTDDSSRSPSRSPRRTSSTERSRSPRNRSSSRRSGVVQPRPLVHTAAGGARRNSMRRLVLSGHIGLSGRKGSAVDDEEGEVLEVEEDEKTEEQRGDDSAPPTTPSSPRAAASSLALPTREQAHSRSSSIQWLTLTDTAHERERAPARPSNSRSTSPTRTGGFFKGSPATPEDDGEGERKERKERERLERGGLAHEAVSRMGKLAGRGHHTAAEERNHDDSAASGDSPEQSTSSAHPPLPAITTAPPSPSLSPTASPPSSPAPSAPASLAAPTRGRKRIASLLASVTSSIGGGPHHYHKSAMQSTPEDTAIRHTSPSAPAGAESIFRAPGTEGDSSSTSGGGGGGGGEGDDSSARVMLDLPTGDGTPVRTGSMR